MKRPCLYTESGEHRDTERVCPCGHVHTHRTKRSGVYLSEPIVSLYIARHGKGDLVKLPKPALVGV